MWLVNKSAVTPISTARWNFLRNYRVGIKLTNVFRPIKYAMYMLDEIFKQRFNF